MEEDEFISINLLNKTTGENTYVEIKKNIDPDLFLTVNHLIHKNEYISKKLRNLQEVVALFLVIFISINLFQSLHS